VEAGEGVLEEAVGVEVEAGVVLDGEAVVGEEGGGEELEDSDLAAEIEFRIWSVESALACALESETVWFALLGSGRRELSREKDLRSLSIGDSGFFSAERVSEMKYFSFILYYFVYIIFYI
jgi:hypothetical protein